MSELVEVVEEWVRNVVRRGLNGMVQRVSFVQWGSMGLEWVWMPSVWHVLLQMMINALFLA